jgi:hypothetical protein
VVHPPIKDWVVDSSFLEVTGQKGAVRKDYKVNEDHEGGMTPNKGQVVWVSLETEIQFVNRKYRTDTITYSLHLF